MPDSNSQINPLFFVRFDDPILGYLRSAAKVCQHQCMEQSDIRTAVVAFLLAGVVPAIMIIVLMVR